MSSTQKAIEVKQHKENFVNDAINLIKVHGAQIVYISDQGGFKLEIHSGRTLYYEGIENVENIVQSVSSTTHSYTTQPKISAEG